MTNCPWCGDDDFEVVLEKNEEYGNLLVSLRCQCCGSTTPRLIVTPDLFSVDILKKRIDDRTERAKNYVNQINDL